MSPFTLSLLLFSYNGDDLAVWQANFGNTLVLTDVG